MSSVVPLGKWFQTVATLILNSRIIFQACWSSDGSEIYAGRRNGIVDMWDVRILGKNYRNTPRLLKSLRNPPSSGAVSAVVAFPDGSHIAW